MAPGTRQTGNVADTVPNQWSVSTVVESDVPVAAGDEHSLALKRAGSLVGWGRSDKGQTSCPSGTNYVQVAAGFIHSLALKRTTLQPWSWR